RNVKKSTLGLAAVAAWMVFMHVLDVFWIIRPMVYATTPVDQLPGGITVWLDVVAIVGALALFTGALVRTVASGVLIPLHDPRQDQALAHHDDVRPRHPPGEPMSPHVQTLPHEHSNPDPWHAHTAGGPAPQHGHGAKANPAILGIVTAGFVITVVVTVLLSALYFFSYMTHERRIKAETTVLSEEYRAY